MKHIFIINAGQNFGHSSGQFNKTITDTTVAFFNKMSNVEVKTTHITDGYNAIEEVEKFTWADVVIYHTPIWWFQVPHDFKKYIDVVFTEGHNKGIYHSDGRRSANPDINYGTGLEIPDRPVALGYEKCRRATTCPPYRSPAGYLSLE